MSLVAARLLLLAVGAAPSPPLVYYRSRCGDVAVRTGEEPADAVTRFAVGAVAAGCEFGPADLKPTMDYLCARTKCTRLPTSYELDVTGIGKMIVLPWQEPAAAVEAFTRRAAKQGHLFDMDGVRTLMQYFCARMKCIRQPASETLDVPEIGQVVIHPWAEPAEMIERFARQALEAGFSFGGRRWQNQWP